MPDHSEKLLRLEIALPESSYALLDQAAAFQRQSISEFVIDAAREAAERVVAGHEVIRLSRADQIHFAEALLNPPPVSEALKRAFKAHRELLDRS